MSADVERRIVTAVLRTGDLVTAQSAGVNIEWFTDLQCRTAWQVILDYSLDPRTAGTVPGLSYMVERMAMVPHVGDASETVAQLSEAMRAARHKYLLGVTMAEAMVLNEKDPAAAHDKLLSAITGRDIESLRSRGRETSLGALAPTLFAQYRESMVDRGVTGVETPFPALTYATKGFQRGEIYCFFAPPKSFKSWLAFNCAVHARRTDPRHVLVITSEMPAEQCAVRHACLMNGWDFNQYRDRRLEMPEALRWHSTDADRRLHFYQPSGFDENAIAEVRAQVQRLNLMGGVSLVVWDGHYRSASSTEWETIYQFVRRTRALALETEIQQPPILIVTQEGSNKGRATHRVYEQECSLMLYLTKTAPTKVLAQTTAMREGPSVEMEISVNLNRGLITEVSAKFDTDSSGQSTGGLV